MSLPLARLPWIRIADGDYIDQILAGQVHLFHHMLTAGAGRDPANAKPVILAEDGQHARGGNHGRSRAVPDQIAAGKIFHSGQFSSETDYFKDNSDGLAQGSKARMMARPVKTPMIATTTDPAAYSAADAICPLCQSTATSSENAENVVKPPRTPVARNTRIS